MSFKVLIFKSFLSKRLFFLILFLCILTISTLCYFQIHILSFFVFFFCVHGIVMLQEGSSFVTCFEFLHLFLKFKLIYYFFKTTKTSQIDWHPLEAIYYLQHSRNIIKKERQVQNTWGLDQNPGQKTKRTPSLPH
jgi:hypothetical protein